MLANRIRKRDDQFELRGWTWHFHHIRDAGPMARLEYDTEEIQWLKLHGHKEPVEIRPGDLDHILPQIGYPVPAGKRRRAVEASDHGEARTVEVPVEKIVEVPIDNPQDKEEIERLQEQLARSDREREEAVRKAKLAAAEAEGAKAERDALKFRVEPEGQGFDALRDVDAAEIEDNLTTLKETLDDRTADFDLFNEDGSVNNDARNKLLDRLIRQEGELRRARKAGATDTLEKEDTVQKLQRFLGILGSRSV